VKNFFYARRPEGGKERAKREMVYARIILRGNNKKERKKLTGSLG
jgi:hypothetical protein